MKKFACIHGHFYQPPRENPWLEEIELQESAFPYPDWNERITEECYAPNTASRILDPQGSIIDIVNNYAKISFNFGPTLLSWMQRIRPEIYQSILDADELSQEIFDGHGSALAQAYNHMILPLANECDKQTQVLWGIKDFEHHFKRKPEGMWLPETAVDVKTLEVLAANGIKFTILAPHQANKVKRIEDEEWQNIGEGGVDPHRAYLCNLPNKQKIVVFFYDGPISHDIAFGGVLRNGEDFARRLTEVSFNENNEPRLVHVATDGETYGHHHRFGNMALSYCLHHIQADEETQLTIYGAFLEQHPPEFEVAIAENTSWSCSHGVERWRSDCGCAINPLSGWTQQWREVLRESMDWLRDKVAEIFEKEMKAFTDNPWSVRNQYIDVILDRSKEALEQYITKQIKKTDNTNQEKILKLLEMQRYAMLMYTSCGWFFDDVSGIETVQILQYAARVMQLAKETSQKDFEQEFIQKLSQAKSNVKEFTDGADVYKKTVQPTIVNLLNVGAHYAISSLFEEYEEQVVIYSYAISLEKKDLYEVGKQRLVIGKARIFSNITQEQCLIDFSVLYFGDYNLSGGVRIHKDDKSYDEMHMKLQDIFTKNNIPEAIQMTNDYFGVNNYSLWSLFKNEQSKVLNQVFGSTSASIETHFRQIYDHYYPLMCVNPEIRIPLPKALAMTVEFILNRDLIEALESDAVDVLRLEKLAQEIKRWAFARDKEAISYVASKRINKLMEEFFDDHKKLNLLESMSEILRILNALDLSLDLWKTQNIYFAMSRDVYGPIFVKAKQHDKKAREWISNFEKLGQILKVKNNDVLTLKKKERVGAC